MRKTKTLHSRYVEITPRRDFSETDSRAVNSLVSFWRWLIISAFLAVAVWFVFAPFLLPDGWHKIPGFFVESVWREFVYNDVVAGFRVEKILEWADSQFWFTFALFVTGFSGMIIAAALKTFFIYLGRK